MYYFSLRFHVVPGLLYKIFRFKIVHKRTEPQQRIDALTQTIPRQCEQCLKYQNEIRILRNKLISNKQFVV